jgi:hypothetical protein
VGTYCVKREVHSLYSPQNNRRIKQCRINGCEIPSSAKGVLGSEKIALHSGRIYASGTLLENEWRSQQISEPCAWWWR